VGEDPSGPECEAVYTGSKVIARSFSQQSNPRISCGSTVFFRNVEKYLAVASCIVQRTGIQKDQGVFEKLI
jgi:hypothetical protein